METPLSSEIQIPSAIVRNEAVVSVLLTRAKKNPLGVSSLHRTIHLAEATNPSKKQAEATTLVSKLSLLMKK